METWVSCNIFVQILISISCINIIKNILTCSKFICQIQDGRFNYFNIFTSKIIEFDFIKSFMKNTIILLALSVVIFLTSCQKKTDTPDFEGNAKAIDTMVQTAFETDTMPTFNRSLKLQNIGFQVTVTGDQLTIQPSGYELDNTIVTKEIAGMTVTNAEIEDLNSDSFPEILVYLNSDGSGSYGTVLGYSSNQNKSMSEISFPSISDNHKANKGYMGHDEFAVVETTLSHRFPIYLNGDTNSKPSGKMRQIQYKLKDGEASRIFVVDKILEF